MEDATFYRSARDAIVRYIREIALLPSFPFEISESVETSSTERVVGPVLRVVAINDVIGQVLPRTEDTWLAIRPFHDITKSTLPAWTTALMERRMAAIALLVRLSASLRFEWNAMMDCGGDRPAGSSPDPQKAFWLELLRELCTGTMQDEMMSMERTLVALSRSKSPRFLLCVHSDPSQVDFGDLLEQLLWANNATVVEGNDKKNIFDGVLDTCGLSHGPISTWPIEFGLSFTHGKITHAIITKLFDVIERLQSSEQRPDGIKFRLTALRIGKGCSIQPKALETIRERWGQDNDLTSLSLGSIDDVKPSSVQECLVRLTNEPTSKLRRLAVTAGDIFPAFASAFRAPNRNAITEIDVHYGPPEENAAWLAFAFFHVDSCSSVTSICLRVENETSYFNNEWMEAFERTLQSIDPSEDLIGEARDQGEVSERTFVAVKAATPVKSHPYSGAKLLCKINGDDNGNEPIFERLTQVKKLVGIVIPGLGIGWIPETCVAMTETKPSRLQDQGSIQHNRSITSLTIVRPRKSELLVTIDQHIANILRFLSLIGDSLEHLQLPDCQFRECDLAQILQYCPNLKELNIYGHKLSTIQPLIDAYESKQCQISTLSLSFPFEMIDHNTDDPIVVQVMELCHHKQATDLPLQYLRMHLFSHRNGTAMVRQVKVATAESLAIAMSACPTLQFVHFTSNVPWVTDLTLHHHLPFDFSTGVGRNLFPLTCKLAFLSIVKRNQRLRSDYPAVGQLDTHVLSRIFTFSGQAIARHVLRCHETRIRETE